MLRFVEISTYNQFISDVLEGISKDCFDRYCIPIYRDEKPVKDSELVRFIIFLATMRCQFWVTWRLQRSHT